MPRVAAKKTETNPMTELRSRLSKAGVKRKFLNEVVLPEWWDDSIALSPGGFREATAYVCSFLGYSLISLLSPSQELTFTRQSGVKYKKGKGATVAEVALATQYAQGVARSVAAAYVDKAPVGKLPEPKAWRDALLKKSGSNWITLDQILEAAWTQGIPVIHLKNFPTTGKKPDALVTMVVDRPVIVVLSGRKSPSWLAFIIAHELGHIHNKHVKPGETLVDEKMDAEADEVEEVEANDFAVNLLTGSGTLGLNTSRAMSPPCLSALCKEFSSNYRVAPGVVALNYAFTSGQWPLAMAALAMLEPRADAGKETKHAMKAYLNPDDLSEESWEWINRATSAGK